MADFTFKANTTFLEEKYVTWAEVGLDSPDLSIFPAGLWTWGGNYRGGLGQGDRTSRSSPVQVGALTNWKNISAGGGHVTAIKNDGTLWSWGTNAAGTLGLGNTYHRSSPVQIGSLTTWRKISSAGSIFVGVNQAIKTDGTLWAWGYNQNGGLGVGDRVHRSSPTQVGTDTNWNSVSTSSGSGFTLAIKTDGTLWSWGFNYDGQLGIGFRSNYSLSINKVGALTNWKQASAGHTHSLAVKTDGTLWAWGKNTYSQLGIDGGTVHRSSPVQVGSLTTWKSVSAGGNFTLAIKTDGTLWAWGKNNYGQLGVGDTTNRNTIVQVGTLTNWKSVAAGGNQSAAVKTDGTIWAWGQNSSYGQLGQNDLTNRLSPVQIGSLTNWKSISTSFGPFMVALKLV